MATIELPSYAHPMQQDVALFHRAFGAPDHIINPGPLPADRVELRLSLIREEGVVELRQALGRKPLDLVEIIDSLIDTIYVSFGTLVEMGQDYTPVETPFSVAVVTDPIEDYTLMFDAAMISMYDGLTKALEEGNVEASVLRTSQIISSALEILTLMGLDPQPFFDEIQRSNMSKLGADGKPIYSRGVELDGAPEGKVLKGPNYSAPNLKRVLDELVRDDRFAEIRKRIAKD